MGAFTSRPPMVHGFQLLRGGNSMFRTYLGILFLALSVATPLRAEVLKLSEQKFRTFVSTSSTAELVAAAQEIKLAILDWLEAMNAKRPGESVREPSSGNYNGMLTEFSVVLVDEDLDDLRKNRLDSLAWVMWDEQLESAKEELDDFIDDSVTKLCHSVGAEIRRIKKALNRIRKIDGQLIRERAQNAEISELRHWGHHTVINVKQLPGYRFRARGGWLLNYSSFKLYKDDIKNKNRLFKGRANSWYNLAEALNKQLVKVIYEKVL